MARVRGLRTIKEMEPAEVNANRFAQLVGGQMSPDAAN
jgi:hypothetical protein